MSPATKFNLQATVMWVTLTSMLIAMGVGLWKGGAANANMKAAVIAVSRDVTQTKVDLSDQKSRFIDHCESSREMFRKQSETDDAIKKEMKDMSYKQGVVITKIDNIDKTLEKIERKIDN